MIKAQQRLQDKFMEDNKNKKLVWWVVIIVVILIAAAFAVYYWQSGIYTLPTGQGTTLLPPSDTVTSIEADLNATNLNDLDKELADIDKELAQ